MAFSSGKAPPGPYDALLLDVPIMCLRLDQKGQQSEDGVIQWHAERVPYAPGTTTPEGAPFYVEPSADQPEGFFSFSGGMGTRVQDPKRDRDTESYYHGHWIDGAGDIVFNGPATTTVTPTSTGQIEDMFDAVIPAGGTDYVMALAGQYLLQRTADTTLGWSNVSKDFGAGVTPLRAEVFRGTQAVPYAFIACGSTDKYWVWSMATATTVFTQHATLKAIDFLSYRNALWMLNQDANGAYQVQQCLDGGTAPTWSGAFIICDATNVATGFEVHNDVLYVRTQKGLRAVSAGQDYAEEITGSEFHHVQLAPNNCHMVSFLQWILVPMYRSYYSFLVDGTMMEIGLTALRRNDSPVTGIPTAAWPYGTWYVLVAFWDEATSTAYLMKFGNYKIYSTLFSPIPRREFVPSWLGALYEQSSMITNLYISEAAGGPYCYIGDAAGKITCYRLPRVGPDATGDTGWVQFNQEHPFQLYCSGITRGNPGVPKAVTGIEITGQNLNATVSYRPGRTGTYGGSTDLQNGGLFNSDPGGRQYFLNSVLTRWLDLLVTGTATSASTPCIVETVAAYVVPRPPFRHIFTFKMLIGSRVVDKNLNVIKEYDTKGWLAAIVNLCETGPVAIVTPEGNSYLALITSFKLDASYNDVKGVDTEYIGTVEMMQHIPLNNQGEHAHLGNYTHAQLASYKHAQLSTL